MNIHFAPMRAAELGQAVDSPFIQSLRTVAASGTMPFSVTAVPAQADIIIPDLDLDMLVNPKRQVRLASILAGCPGIPIEHRQKICILTAAPDFPRHLGEGMRFVSLATAGRPPDCLWFCDDLWSRDTRRDADFCYDLDSPSFLLHNLPRVGTTLAVVQTDVFRNPTLVASALLASRFYVAQAPAIGGLQEYVLFLLSLSAGCIPIIIGHSPLPGAPTIDYDDIAFRVGHNTASLTTIRNIARTIRPEEVRDRAAAARALYLRHFTPQVALPQIMRAIRESAPTSHPIPPIQPQRFENRDALFEYAWQQVFIRPTETPRLAIYGCGKLIHTLVTALARSERHLKVKELTILDDAPAQQQFMGHSVLHPSQAPAVDTVILGSDHHEPRLREKARRVFGQNVSIRGISDVLREAGMNIIDYWTMTYAYPTKVSPMAPPPLSMGSKPLLRAPTRPERIQYLSGIMVCVGYADFLEWTLPLNIRHFDRLVVVTSPDDLATQRVARTAGATLVVSDSYRVNGAPFNKGKMLNAGVSAVDADGWLLFTDADIILPDDCRSKIASLTVDTNTLYHASRFNIPSDNHEQWLRRYVDSREGVDQITFYDCDPFGYFQLFSPRALPIRALFPAVCSETFDNAGGIDIHFFRMWHDSPECATARLDLSVLHIPHGAWSANWEGRVDMPLNGATKGQPQEDAANGWTMVAYIRGGDIQMLKPIPRSGFIKLVDCANGASTIIANGNGYPRFVCHTHNDILMAGICSGEPGETSLAFDTDGRPLSGWGIGVLPGTNIRSWAWANTSIKKTSFMVYHNPCLPQAETGALVRREGPS